MRTEPSWLIFIVISGRFWPSGSLDSSARLSAGWTRKSLSVRQLRDEISVRSARARSMADSAAGAAGSPATGTASTVVSARTHPGANAISAAMAIVPNHAKAPPMRLDAPHGPLPLFVTHLSFQLHLGHVRVQQVKALVYGEAVAGSAGVGASP